MRMSWTRGWPAAAVVAAALVLSLGTATAADDDTVTVALSTTLSGAIGPLGQANKNGIELAIEKINAAGGVLGKQIKLLVAEDQAKPPVAATNTRNFILTNKARAIFGSTSSAVSAAMGGVAAQYRVPIFYSTSNDIDLTGRSFSKYAFELVPTSYMEPHAVAVYIANRAKAEGWKTFYTISPDYSFGRTTVKEFLAGMGQAGVEVELVGQQWPALGASDFGQYVSAIVAKKPDFVFVVQYSGDLVTLTKQAANAGMFKNSSVYAGYWLDALEALGADAPAGVISSDRAQPFYATDSDAMKEFAQRYHEKYQSWPASWAIMGYSAVETWVQGVEKAGTFDADAVAAALEGITIDSALRGSFTIRACDHVAEVPEYMGILSDNVHPEYGIRTLTDIEEIPAGKIMMSCDAKMALRAR